MSGLTFAQHLTDHPTSDERRAEIFAAPGFGKYFTDHMSVVNWTQADGWTGHRVVPLAPFTMHQRIIAMD